MGAVCSCFVPRKPPDGSTDGQPKQVHFQEQVNEHCGKANSQEVAAGRHELQGDPQEWPNAHHHEPSLQQKSAGRHETDGELEGLSKISRSLERGVPASVSSPNLLAETLQQHAVPSKQAGAQRAASEGNKMHRSTSWGQAPAVISRMTSWKEAEKDYSAMQVALQNFPGSSPERSTRAASYQPEGTPLHREDRELSSAPELFTDAAMRNALRKIAALQAKPQPRSRASSARTSALTSARVSSEAEAAPPYATPASRDPSPLPRAAHTRPMQEAAWGRLSYSTDLSGLPPGSQAASSDAGSVMGSSRPASTDAGGMPKPAAAFHRFNDTYRQRAGQNPSEVLLSQPSRPTSVDMQAHASSSRGPSGDLAHSSCSHSAHLGTVQRKPSDNAGGGHLSNRASDESANEQHVHAAGSLLPHDLLPRAANGGLGSSTARQLGPAASGMRRVPENRAAEAYEILMSRAGGSQGGSINSEDAAAVSAYVRDSLAWSSDRAQHGTESQTSGDSRMSSMGPHDGSAVVRPGDAHAALRRALSLVKKQGSVVVPEEAQEAIEQQSQPSPGDWQSRQRGQQVLSKQGSEQPSDTGIMNGHGGYQSDAAMSAFIRKAFKTPTS